MTVTQEVSAATTRRKLPLKLKILKISKELKLSTMRNHFVFSVKKGLMLNTKRLKQLILLLTKLKLKQMLVLQVLTLWGRWALTVQAELI